MARKKIGKMDLDIHIKVERNYNI